MNGKFNMDGHNQDIFFQNQGTFFDFQKRAGEASPLPLPLVERLYTYFVFKFCYWFLCFIVKLYLINSYWHQRLCGIARIHRGTFIFIFNPLLLDWFLRNIPSHENWGKKCPCFFLFISSNHCLIFFEKAVTLQMS